MKTTLTIISILFVTSLFSQIDVNNDVIFADQVSYLEVFSTNCEKLKPLELDGNRIYLFDIVKCNNSKEKLLVFKKEMTLFYCEYSLVNQLKFNVDFYFIDKGFKSMSKKEKAIYQNRINSVNQKFYSDLRAKEQELENIRIAEEQKRITDSIERATFLKNENQRIYLENYKKGYNQDSLNLKNSKELFAELNLIDSMVVSNELQSLKEEKKKIDINGGVILTLFDFDDNENSIGLIFSILNCNKKRIKYIEFNVKAFNSVNDQVKSTETLKGIGFINSNDVGVWSFDDVWYSNIISYVKISSIKITFEDGATRNISDVSKIDYSIDGKVINYIIKSNLYLNRKEIKIGNHKFIERVDKYDLKYCMGAKDEPNLKTVLELEFIDLNSESHFISSITINLSTLEQMEYFINEYNNNNKNIHTENFSLSEFNKELINIYGVDIDNNTTHTVIEYKDFLLLRDKIKTLKIDF